MQGAFRLDLETGRAVAVPVDVDDDQMVSPQALLDDGRPLPDVDTPQYLSADGQHVMAVLRQREGPFRYRLEVYDRETRERVGAVPSHVSYVPFYVSESRVILQTEMASARVGGQQVEQPRAVMAVDLNTGEQIWSRPIGEVKFQGAPPP